MEILEAAYRSAASGVLERDKTLDTVAVYPFEAGLRSQRPAGSWSKAPDHERSILYRIAARFLYKSAGDDDEALEEARH